LSAGKPHIPVHRLATEVGTQVMNGLAERIVLSTSDLRLQLIERDVEIA
jgi:hypothetical protein